MLRYILILLVLAGIAVGDVYLVKSKFTSNYWQAFIPADDKGEYYYTVGFGTPMNDDGYLPNMTVIDMTFGKLCDAKQGAAIGANGLANSTDFTQSGGTFGVALGQLDGDYNVSYNNGGGRVFTIDPPDTHNELHLFVYLVSNTQAGAAITWGDGSTTGLSATDLGADAATVGIREIIVVKGVTIGARTIKIAATEVTRIVGYRSWDSSTKGDLSSDGDDCLITQFKQLGTAGPLTAHDASTTLGASNTFSLTDNTTIGKAYECAFQWDSGGTDYDFTGGNQHYNSGEATNNAYAMSTAYSVGLRGPEIFIDDVRNGCVFDDSGTDDTSTNAAFLTDSTAAWKTNGLVGMTVWNTTQGTSGVITANTGTTVTATMSSGDWDSGNAYIIGWPRGTKLSGTKIVLHHKGTIAGATSGTAPNCDWTYIITETGLTIVVTTTWQSTVVFASDPLIYTPMFPFSAALDAGAKFRFPIDKTEYAIPSEDTNYTGKGNVSEILYKNAGIRLTSLSPITVWKYLNSTSKYYGQISGSMPGSPSPVSGDVFTLGCQYEVRRIKSNGSETWQGVSGSSGGIFGGSRIY